MPPNMPMPMKTEAIDDDADGAVPEEAQRDQGLLAHGPLDEEEGDETERGRWRSR